jgi:glycosyltransferase involved in cell wall biosynthesis
MPRLKLIVQIPAFNEQATIAEAIESIPRSVPGVDRVEVLVIDDGSLDATGEVARQAGADHVFRHTTNRGLAQAFLTGIDACVSLGADIIVNTDADNQYEAGDIPKLIEPILKGTADIVVGDRQTEQVPHFSPVKKRLQKLGSAVVGRLASAQIPDAVSGFRAISREAAMRVNIGSEFSYTIEMLIQAGHERLAIASVPVRTRETARKSRLFRSTPQFLFRSMLTMLRIYVTYKPLRTFVLMGLVLGIIGLLPIVRFLYFYVTGGGAGHVQSLVIGSIFILMGGMFFIFGLLAELIGFNRKILGRMLEKVRRLEQGADHQEPGGGR